MLWSLRATARYAAVYGVVDGSKARLLMATSVLDEILQAASDGREMLDLSCRGLSSLPAEIGMLTKLKALDVSGNQLTSLPQEIGLLARLVELVASGNNLTVLPSQIGQLAELESLSVADNALVNLTAQIHKLTRLRYLHLQHNKLPNLPPEIGNLENLRQLWVQNNRLTDLPRELCRLQALQDWDSTRKQLPPRFPQALLAHDNPLVDPFPELLRKGTRAVLDYLTELSKNYTVDLYDYVPELKNFVIREKLGDFAECGSAIAACREYIDGYLERLGAKAANEMYESYRQLGGIPCISGGPRACVFPHLAYARQRCIEIASNASEE